MPFLPSFVNGFVQISAVCTGGTCYVVMERDFTSFERWNTVFRKKIPPASPIKPSAMVFAKVLTGGLYPTARAFYRINWRKSVLTAYYR
ncbi:hypothetical protein B4914_13435 [Yersinia entomophaga]|nr:hypothetical protein B4914_13435 [Yersinia entomophaga]